MKRRFPKPRTLLILALLLVGGAVVNVAVAWGCAWVLDLERLRKESSEWGFSENQPVGLDWSVELRRVSGAARMVFVFEDHKPSPPRSRDVNKIGGLVIKDDPPAKELAPLWAQQLMQPPMAQLFDGRGWPYISLSCELKQEAAGAPIYPVGGIALQNASSSWAWDYRVLPCRPTWPGFAINTLFYAAILWGLFAAPFALRRRKRIRRGWCPKCAYDLRGRSPESKVCPECGTARF